MQIQTLEHDFLSRTLLREMHAAPKRLYAIGNPDVLLAPAIAVVGTRRPSGYGMRAAAQFSRALSRAGACIVSGLARGIDGIAHRGALDERAPTVAVLGHGLDMIYPREHSGLARQIVGAGGCLLSEYPVGTPPMKHHFPQRNGLIAGLSIGTLVIEAAESSGSLITARLALEANREVFVLPGRFDEDSFRGGHRLIQSGAKLVLGVDDIVAEIGSLAAVVRPEIEGDDALANLFAVHDGVASLERLLAASELPVHELISKIETARETGCVVEIDGQNFLWVAKPQAFLKNKG